MKFSVKKRHPSPSPRNPSPQNHNEVDPQILTLTLENTALKSQLSSLADAESSLELSNLLALANEKNESLQNKVDELHAGLLSIEKERRLFLNSVDKDRNERERRYLQEIEASRSLLTEESRRVETLEGELHEVRKFVERYQVELKEQDNYLKMKEKEMMVLQGRVAEQERRIEVINDENSDFKRAVELLEDEKIGWEANRNELKANLEKMKTELEEIQGQVVMGKEREDGLHHQLADTKDSLEREIEEREAEKQELEAKASQLRDDLMRMETVKKQKNDEIKDMSNLLITAHWQQESLEQTIQDKTQVIDDMQTKLDQKHAEMDVLQADFTKLNDEMKRMKSSHQDTVMLKDVEINSWKKQNQTQSEKHAELSSKYDALKTESDELTGKLEGTQKIIARLETELENTREQLDQMQQRENELAQELEETKKDLAHSQREVRRLNDQIDDMNTVHEEKNAHLSKCISKLKAELKGEMRTSDDLRLKLEKVETKSKQDVEAHQKTLDQMKHELATQNRRHQDQVELLNREHAAQVEELETNGAAVITDLEESVDALKKEMGKNKFEHEHAVIQLNRTISQAHTEKELLERQITEEEKKAKSQTEKIAQLNNLSQHRGEEIIVLQKEMALLRDTMDIATRNHSNTIDSMYRELNDVQRTHQEETNDLQLTINDLRSQITTARARIDTEEEELNTTKSKLSERTLLLKEMVEKTKAYKADYEQEHVRTNELSEVVDRIKSELNEARSMASHYEQEKSRQETHFRDTLRKERQQRKTVEKQLESKSQSFDDITKRCNEIEKENVNLKDKVQRQENYIGKLHERQERSRRAATPLGMSKGNHRPSTTSLSPPKLQARRGSKSAVKKRHCATEEARLGLSFSSNTSVSEDGRQNENEHPKQALHY